MRKRYIQDPKTGKLVEAKLYRREGHFIQGEIAPFRSNVDGTMITSRKELAEHNRRNKVTNDSFEGAIAARNREKEALFTPETPYDTDRRKRAIAFAIEARSGSKTAGEVREMAERYANDT